MVESTKRVEKEGERRPKVSGYTLFTQDYYEKKKKNNEEIKSFMEESKSLKQGWNALKDDEKEKYRMKAKEVRSNAKGTKYVLPFLTRCAPKQFMDVCKSLKDRQDRMDRLKKIGFDKLVNICCSQIPRDLCGKFMVSFDPPTNNVSIRGRSLHIRKEDVKDFMGLPCEGRDIEKKLKKEDGAFKAMKSLYGRVPYKTIAKWLIEREDDPDFEFLFVMYVLGTLLCPGAGIKVSDHVLKVMVATKGAFNEYDWSSLVLNELSNSIAQYKNNVRKGKASEKINIGGCIYFLMIYCLQHFPLGPLQASTVHNAVAYWNDNNVESRVQIEKESNQGMLHSVVSLPAPSSSNLDLEAVLTHSEIKATYDRLMLRVMRIVQEELASLQSRLFGGVKTDEGEHEQPLSSTEHEGSDTEKEEDHEVGGGTDEGGADTQDEVEEEPQELEGEKSEGIEGQDKDDSAASESKEEEELQLRKSTRVKKPAIVSPWVTTMGKKRPKDEKEKEALYNLCTTRCSKEEGEEKFVAMYDYFLTRGELYCLRPRGWINNRFMSMVSKTLVGDELQHSGRVRRHIFSLELMEKMCYDPKKWSWEAHEAEILPIHIGYNIGDCDFIFGPVLRLDHWFCYVLDMKTMRFYVMDSLVDHLTYERLQKEEGELKGVEQGKKGRKTLSQKKQEELRGKERLASQCRDCIVDIVRRVKPELFADQTKIPKEISWAKVHMQCDTDSCGVHVLSWLHGWDGSTRDNRGTPCLSYPRKKSARRRSTAYGGL